MLVFRCWPWILLAAFCGAATPAAADGPPPDRPTAVLAPDPAVVALVHNLAPGASAALPHPRTTGDLNAVARKYGLDRTGPGVRNYCIKMCWMPERQRAIYYGANHGAPHRLNDVWEYELAANTWNCLYGPDGNKHANGDWSDVDWEHTQGGYVRTFRGGPAVIPHSWWNMTYDPERRAMYTFCTWSMALPRAFEIVQKGPHKPPLWSFEPEKGRWEPVTNSTFHGKPPGYENARALEYLPELGGSVWIKSDGMWLYSSISNDWTELKPNGGDMKAYWANMPDREQVVVYAPDRHLLIAHSRHVGKAVYRTTQYDIAKNSWQVACEGSTTNGPPGGFDAQTGFVYDRVARVGLLTDPDSRSLWCFDPDTAQWTKIAPNGPPVPGGAQAGVSYYDVTHNALVIPGMWVYRHRSTAQ